MKGLGNILKQAQEMQGKMAQLQEEMAKATATGQAGGGMVDVTMNGRHEVTRVKIDPAAAEDLEMLEDLVAAAVNEAARKVQELSQQQMAKLTGGMNIPGLGSPFS